MQRISLLSEPYIDTFDDGRKILISIRNWVLPTNLICFVWYCKDEIPPQEIKVEMNGKEK